MLYEVITVTGSIAPVVGVNNEDRFTTTPHREQKRKVGSRSADLAEQVLLQHGIPQLAHVGAPGVDHLRNNFV